MSWDGKQLKYGCLNPEGKASIKLPMGASEVIKAASGKFVKLDNSGRGEIAVDGSSAIFGWVEAPEETTSSTEGATKYNCIIDVNALFKIPVNAGTYAVAMRGKSCDLSVSSSIQGVQLDASAEDTVIVVDGDEDNNEWVIVKINPNKLAAAGVV